MFLIFCFHCLYIIFFRPKKKKNPPHWFKTLIAQFNSLEPSTLILPLCWQQATKRCQACQDTHVLSSRWLGRARLARVPSSAYSSVLFMCSVVQSCLTLCHTMDCSPPGSSVHGDSPGKNMAWVAISSSRGSS